MSRDGQPGPATHGGGRPGRVVRWLGELVLGARLVVAGGREGWLRAGLTAVGVGLGVALLLLATSVPSAWQARADRVDRVQFRWDQQVAPGDGTLLVRPSDMEFRDETVRGVRVQPEGPAAPTPPGVAQLPGPGELVVSPALARLLESPEGELLRPRLDYPVAGVIGQPGLGNPHQLAFYLGDDTLAGDEPELRIDHFGMERRGEPLDPLLLMLLVLGVVVLLLPVAMFVAVAVRFGGERRDRRLAAVRLAGADAGTTRRIAAGEALLAAVLGLAVGGGLFLIGRQLVEEIVVFDISVFASDVRPATPLLALVLAGTPALAVAVTVLAMRGLVVEPLGVVRRTRGVRRRLWWRLVPPVAGLLLLYPLIDRDPGSGLRPYQLAAGAGLVLLGVATLLPWLVDTVVRRQHGRGPVSWQLALRRLQLSGGSVGRIVNGTAVAAAGAIALQMFFSGVQGDFVQTRTPDPDRDPARVVLPEGMDAAGADVAAGRFAATTGVRSVANIRAADAIAVDRDGIPRQTVGVGACADLARLAELEHCADGDVFVAGAMVGPGLRLRFGVLNEDGPQWTIPDSAEAVALRDDPGGFDGVLPQVLATPGATGLPEFASYRVLHLELDPGNPDAIEHVRNTAFAVDPSLQPRRWQPVTEDDRYSTIRRGLLLGVAATLALIGLSLLVSTVEQLRERRRQLAVLVAFGTRRRTLAWSVLWQTALPMVPGLLLAVGAGVGLGAVLLAMADRPAEIDLANIATVTGITGAVVLLVTALTLPVLWRLMRPDGLRTE